MQKAAFFDVDGTLTTTHVWRGLMEYFRQHKFRRLTHYAFLTYHAPKRYFLRKGWITELSFRTSWALDLAWYVRGLSIVQTEPIWGWVTTNYLKTYWRTDVLERLKSHQQNGDLVVLVSAGPLPLIQRIAFEYGVEHVVGTRLETKNNLYTGHSIKPACIGEYKVELSKVYLAKNNLEIDFENSAAYADSITDLPMLDMVGKPVITYADDELKITARLRRWEVFPVENPIGG